MSSTITTSIDIDVPVEQVWKILTDFSSWPLRRDGRRDRDWLTCRETPP